jgi:hypothetical protein
MARQNDAPESGWVLVDIVIAAMAHLPALAHKPSRNFVAVRLKRRFWYGWPPVLCANICAFETVSSTRHEFTIPPFCIHHRELMTRPRCTLLLFQSHSASARTHAQIREFAPTSEDITRSSPASTNRRLVFCRARYMSFTARKKIPDPIPLVVPMRSVASVSPSFRLTALERPALSPCRLNRPVLPIEIAPSHPQMRGGG